MLADVGNKNSAGSQKFNHIPGGSNVLGMDGHVEFTKYPGKFPVTEYVAAAFGNQRVAGNAFDFSVN